LIDMATNFTNLKFFSTFRRLNFRYLWLSAALQNSAVTINMIAKSWLVLMLTGSTLLMGLTNAIGAIPLFLGFFGGVTADRFNRRKLLIFFRAINIAQAFVVAFLLHTGLLAFWHVIAVILITGVIDALAGPTESVFLVDIVGKHDLMNAMGLNRITAAFMGIIGSFLVGVFIEVYGIGFCYLVEAIMRMVSLVSFSMIRVEGQTAAIKPGNPFLEIKEGLKYIRSNHSLLGLLAIALYWNFFVSVNGFRLTLLPIFARDILYVGASGYGLLMAADKVGTFLGALMVANLGGFKRKGWLLIISAVLMGVGLILFPMMGWFPLSLTTWSIVGLMTSLYNSTSEVLLLTTSSEEMRGRVMGARFQVWMFMPINAAWAGALADLAGVAIAMEVGGVLWLAAVSVTAILMSNLRKLE